MKYKTRFTLFFLAMILYSLASNFAHPVTPTLIQNLKLHDYMFGVALAVMMIANFLMSPFWGKMNNYIGSRTTLLISCIGYGTAQMGFGLADSEITIGLARFFAGLFVGGIFVSFLTYVVNVAEPEDQAKYLTYSATIQSVAGAFGYLIGGMLGEFSIRFVFWLQAGALILTGVLFYVICLPDANAKDKFSFEILAKDANPMRAFLDSRHFMTMGFALLFLVNILINFGNTGFDQAFNYYLKDQLHLTSAYNGMIKAGVGLVSFVANMSLCIWIIRKTDRRKSMVWLNAVCTAAASATIFVPWIGLFVAFSVLVYAGYSVSLPVLQSMVADMANPKQKNLVMGFYNATKSLGSIAGSLTAGFIYAAGAKLPFVCTAVIYGAGILIAVLYWKKTVEK